MANEGYSPQAEAALAEKIASFYDDPYGFVMFAYPWGEPTMPDGSANPLKDRKSPEPWQKKLLVELGVHIHENLQRQALGLDMMVWRSARVSGHGVGKSALVAWLNHFFMCTRPDTRGVVTANTAAQLASKTWPELAKWHNLLICKHWFKWEATKYFFAKYPEDRQKNYMVEAATVSETNTEAFAGLHNEGKTVFVIFDEASGIHAKIWEVAIGAFTDGEGFFFAFGNPTQPVGDFADCFDKNAEFYNTDRIDSREVSFANKQYINDTIKMLGGEDSDEAKVRFLGIFPAQSYNGFISTDTVHDAIQREFVYDSGAPLIMSIDVARFGDDETVFGWRQGRDARSRKMLTFRRLSAVRVAQIAMDLCNKEMPDAIVIESTGPGSGVIDILRDRGYKVIEVHPGSPSHEPQHYVNKRCELWAKMRDWLVNQGCIGDDPILFKQLTTIQYTLDRAEQRIKLEAKEDMKKRTGLSPPDRGDTLSLTFGVTIARRDANLTRGIGMKREMAITEYDPVGY